MQTQRLFLACICLLAAALASAQTATWIGPGSYSGPLTADWNDPANWDPAGVPASGTVVINQSTPWSPSTPVAGGARPVLTGGASLDRISFDLPAANTSRYAGLYVGSSAAGNPTGHLQLTGTGLSVQAGAGSPFVTLVEVTVEPGSFLDFRNQATLTNTGSATFRLNLIGNGTSAATLRFFDDAAPGAGVLTPSSVFAAGRVRYDFHDRANAGTSNFYAVTPNGMAEFHDQASAGSSTFTIGYGGMGADGIVRFGGASTAAQGTIKGTNMQAGAVEFVEQADGGTATVQYLRRLDITGVATGTGTTGRVRATTSGLAPASVVADDARTVRLGSVTVWDVLLGSNTLEVGSGYILNLRDSGGAYRSAAGENLVGGRLIKVGPGFLTLTGPTYNPADPLHPSYNVITATSIVRGGQLTLYNRLASVVVESGGTLSGTGIVDGNLVNQGRYLQEGGQSLRVTGDYTQTAGGAFEARASSGSLYPNAGLSVTGTANLAGRLVTSAYAGLFANRAPGSLEIEVLTAGGINGRFDTLDTSGQSVRIKTLVDYQPNRVALRYDFLPIADLAATPTQRALGAYLDRIYSFDGQIFPNNFQAIVDGLNGATSLEVFQGILDNFAPDRYGALPDQAFATAAARRSDLDRWLHGLAPAARDGVAVFFTGSNRERTLKPAAGLPEAGFRTTGGTAGALWRHGPWSLGAFVAVERSRGELDRAGSRGDTDSVEPGLLAQYRAGGFFIDAAASRSRDEHTLSRVVNYLYYGNVTRQPSAAPEGSRRDLSCTVGYEWNRRGLTVRPFAGVVQSRWAADTFTEASPGVPFAHEPMTIADWTADSRRWRAGVAVAADLWHDRVRLTLTATGWRELETERPIPARFRAATASYAAPGRLVEEDLRQVAAGLEWRINRHLTASLTAAGMSGDHSRPTRDFTLGLGWAY